ncbi:hypothetical protein PanWU01x14_002640 [Parasponia andersonii]|uniref:Uncharacterized protein n=1 Tax=Parasponia andersonii TaxID=3476 RepID=A0A2P5E579_PARAD|nr:hypothetical protein PanWU01x14_002640 [Parasponia andersonii]
MEVHGQASHIICHRINKMKIYGTVGSSLLWLPKQAIGTILQKQIKIAVAAKLHQKRHPKFERDGKLETNNEVTKWLIKTGQSDIQYLQIKKSPRLRNRKGFGTNILFRRKFAGHEVVRHNQSYRGTIQNVPNTSSIGNVSLKTKAVHAVRLLNREIVEYSNHGTHLR